ncbi:hypothetical protein BC828DRAFT_376659 [Blastocladiella britannica]|nr:hypothetical protein BC828DRAFT_376659 [Blastocladiella britannica]
MMATTAVPVPMTAAPSLSTTPRFDALVTNVLDQQYRQIIVAANNKNERMESLKRRWVRLALLREHAPPQSLRPHVPANPYLAAIPLLASSNRPVPTSFDRTALERRLRAALVTLVEHARGIEIASEQHLTESTHLLLARLRDSSTSDVVSLTAGVSVIPAALAHAVSALGSTHRLVAAHDARNTASDAAHAYYARVIAIADAKLSLLAAQARDRSSNSAAGHGENVSHQQLARNVTSALKARLAAATEQRDRVQHRVDSYAALGDRFMHVVRGLVRTRAEADRVRDEIARLRGVKY